MLVNKLSFCSSRLYLSFDPLQCQGCFQSSSQTEIAFLFFPLTCWDFLNRTEPPITITPSFLPPLIYFLLFFFSPLAFFDPLSCRMASASWSVTLHQQPCLLCDTRAQVTAVQTELKWVALTRMSVFQPCYAQKPGSQSSPEGPIIFMV